VRFDESRGYRKPTTVIPKTWRFVGVSNGRTINANNLWFQDSDGNIYVAQGFVADNEEFIIVDHMQKLAAK
jgi:hypothetical protein